MSVSIKKGLAAGAVAVTAASGISLAAAPAVSAPQSAASPSLHAVISHSGLKLTGDKNFNATRVSISMTAKGKERELAIYRFRGNYTFKDLQKDITYFNKHQNKKGLKHLNHALKHTTLYGGIDADAGKTVTETTVLDAGTYYVAVDTSNGLPKHPHKITATGATVDAPAPASSATVTATPKNRFSGDKVLPAHGTITFANDSDYTPHFLELQHVKNGTTKKQVEKGLQSNQEPKWLRKGSVGTDAISPGHSQTLHYNVPKGEYVALCFFPDPKTGMPHAFMGMIRILHLK